MRGTIDMLQPTPLCVNRCTSTGTILKIIYYFDSLRSWCNCLFFSNRLSHNLSIHLIIFFATALTKSPKHSHQLLIGRHQWFTSVQGYTITWQKVKTKISVTFVNIKTNFHLFLFYHIKGNQVPHIYLYLTLNCIGW